MVNPLVTDLKAGRSSLICIRYNSEFRDLTLKKMEELFKPKESLENKPGLGVRNKKLEERLKREREEAAKEQPVDPKAKNAKAPAPAPAKKEEPKKPDPKAPKKTPQQEEEERLEAERVKREAEEAELARQKALEDAFDKTAELKSMGGRLYDFDVEDPFKRTQHYEWLLPIYYRHAEDPGMDQKKLKCIFLEARTTTVPRSLVANVQTLDFGEVPVALRVTKEILIKNTGVLDEAMRMQSLTPFGGFCVLNALRTITPGQTSSVVVQFEPLAQQVYEERIVMNSQHTTVSVFMKGRGVRPEVTIEPEEGLLNFGNIIVGETYEKTFKIKNISSFAVKFQLLSQVFGIENRKKQVPFLMIPQTATIPARETYEVKIVFQPDFASNHFFDMLLIDIPNQIKPKQIYLRG